MHEHAREIMKSEAVSVCIHSVLCAHVRGMLMCYLSVLFIFLCMSYCRYTAVAMPMLYNTRYSSRRRVAVMIAVVWFLSFAISCPLLFGLNNTGNNYI